MAVHQFSRTTQIIGMNVRLGNCGDAQSIILRHFEIAIEVPLGVDDDRLATALTADEVCILREG